MIRGITWTHIQSVWNHSGPSEPGPLFRKPGTGQELFFAVSYCKPALAVIFYGEIDLQNHELKVCMRN